MFRDVVLQDTRPEEWPAIRARIHQRVAGCMGTPLKNIVAMVEEAVEAGMAEIADCQRVARRIS